MSQTYEIAVVGTGGIADIHAGDMTRLADRAKIVAAVDTDAQRLVAFCDRWHVPRQYDSLSALLAAERPDLVDLATPPGMHAEQACECLSAGLTVWCEKPPALSLAELDEVASAAEAGGGQFAGVFQHRFGAGAQRLRALTRAGDARLGAPMTAVCHTLWYRPDDYFAAPWRGTWQAEGGGPTVGHGIHQMDLALSVLGEWEEVTAVAARRARPTETEDLSAAIVTLASGAVVTMVNSLLSPRETSYLRFDYAHATVELEHLYGYDEQHWRLTPVSGYEEEMAAAWATGPQGRSSSHAAQLTAIFEALDEGAPPPVSLPDARGTMELLAAIYESAFTGTPVRRGDIGPDSPFYHRMDGTGAPWAAGTAA